MTGPEKVYEMVESRNAKSGLRINNSRKKKRRFHITKKQLSLSIILLLLYIGSGIGYVWSNFERTQIGYSLSHMKNEEIRLLEINGKLRLDLAVSKSTGNLEALAIKKLGMKAPSPEQIVVLP
jgi:cell division protein FtsL